MTTKQKIKNIELAMETRYRDKNKKDETAFHCISDNCEPELKKVLMSIIYDENIGGQNNLSYDICYDACAFFDDITDKYYNNDDINGDEYINEYEPSSIYTYDRLQYLNNNNQQEISDVMKEYSIDDIATACAIWYDNMVRQAISTIISDYLNK